VAAQVVAEAVRNQVARIRLAPVVAAEFVDSRMYHHMAGVSVQMMSVSVVVMPDLLVSHQRMSDVVEGRLALVLVRIDLGYTLKG
jgi:hypothetical protein